MQTLARFWRTLGLLAMLTTFVVLVLLLASLGKGWAFFSGFLLLPIVVFAAAVVKEGVTGERCTFGEDHGHPAEEDEQPGLPHYQ